MSTEQVFAPQQWFGFWKKATEDQLQRMQSASEEWTKLTTESLAYGEKLASEWRKLYFDAMKKNAETLAKAG